MQVGESGGRIGAIEVRDGRRRGQKGDRRAGISHSVGDNYNKERAKQTYMYAYRRHMRALSRYRHVLFSTCQHACSLFQHARRHTQRCCHPIPSHLILSLSVLPHSKSSKSVPPMPQNVMKKGN